MNHAEMQSSLGAYALDALDAAEAELIAEHLEECPRCRAEVTAHLETAALLGNFGAEAPAGLWDRIAAEIGGPDESGLPRLDPPPALTSTAPIRPLRPGRARLAIAAMAAAAAILVAFLAVSVVRLDDRMRRVQAAVAAGGTERAAAGVALSPDHRQVRLRSADGRVAADVVIAPNGDGFVVASDLPALAAGRTYQLWGLADGRVVSLGLLGPSPRLASFRVDGAVSQLMVTAEPAGGVVVPDGPVLIQAEVPAA